MKVHCQDAHYRVNCKYIAKMLIRVNCKYIAKIQIRVDSNCEFMKFSPDQSFYTSV
jgi:hypothetical protein